MTPDSVQELLDSEDFGDRIRGLNHLRQLEPKLAFGMIRPLVNDPNTRVRYAAVSQLDTLGHEDIELSLELLRDRLLNDPEPDVVAAAADALGGLKLTEAFEDLKQVYYQTSEWLIQFSILAALGELGDPRGFELLQDALSSETNLMKMVAISALGELGDKRAVASIVPFAGDADWQIRHRAAQALGTLGGTTAVSTLEQLAADEVEQVAREAKVQLAKA